MDEKDEWVSLSDAGKHFGVHKSTITRIIAKQKLETRTDPADDRPKLVNIRDLENIFNNSPQYKKRMQKEQQRGKE